MINSREIKDLHPILQEKAKTFLIQCKANGLDIIITQTLRDSEYQDKLYYDGIKTGKVVTKARGGSSYHNYGLAFDIAIKVNGKIDWNNEELYKKAGSIGKKLMLEWGGDFKILKDLPHFQYRYSEKWKRFLTINDLKNGATL